MVTESTQTRNEKEVVVIPTFRRPELLALCLEKLAQSRDCPEVLICADHGSNMDDIEYCRDTRLPFAHILEAKPHVSVPSGTWNILNAINEGGKVADEVYLVEEDVMVFPGFFEGHSLNNSDVSCGRRVPRYEWYTNPGTCFRRPLLDVLAPHVCDEYFADTAAYCKKHFRQMEFSSTLDDGLIRRVIANHRLTFSFPDKPLCAHQGIHGLGNMDIYQIKGSTLEERIESVRKILADPPNKNRYAKEWEEYRP